MEKHHPRSWYLLGAFGLLKMKRANTAEIREKIALILSSHWQAKIAECRSIQKFLDRSFGRP